MNVKTLNKLSDLETTKPKTISIVDEEMKPKTSIVYNGIGLVSKGDNSFFNHFKSNEIGNEVFALENIKIKNVPDGGIRVTSNYSNRRDKRFNKINIKKVKVENYRTLGISIHATNAEVNISDLEIVQTNAVLDFEGGTALGIAAPVDRLIEGNVLVMGEYKVKYPKSSIFFAQNLKKWNIRSIEVDSALYNKDGTDSYFNVATFVKFDNAVSDSTDNRRGWIGKIKFTNSNQNLNLRKPDGSSASKFRRAVWFDEGFNNCDIDTVDVDYPLAITPSSEYSPKSTGSHLFKYIRLRKKIRKQSSVLYNSQANLLFADTTTVQLRNMIVDTLKARHSLIYIDDKTVIKVKDIDRKTKIIKL